MEPISAWMRSRLRERREETPSGITLAAGTVVISVGDFVAASIPAHDARARYAVATVLLAVIGGLSADWLASGALVLIAWLLMNGFLVNRLGTLSWHGWPDVYRFVALAGGALAGLAAGEIFRAVRAVKERDRARLLVHARSMESNEEKRRA